MKRNCSLNDISDGNLYGLNDLVELNCNGCQGSAACCHGMGTSIILDPLGRYYENQGFKYFLQINECPNHISTKRKVSKWIDTANLERNEAFLTEWHYFLNEVESKIKSSQDEKLIKSINMYLLNLFYLKSYDINTDFFLQFGEHLSEARKTILI